MKALGTLGLALLASVAAQAETPAEKAVREAKNYDTLLQYYPKRALAAGEQGLVGFTIRLDKAGHPTNCEVTYSSGHRMLDEETCQLMLIHGVFDPVKTAQGNKTNQVAEGVVNWKIPDAAANTVAPVKVSSASAPQKMICKRALRTGTLAGYERTCLTLTEWQRQTDEMKRNYDEVQGRYGFTRDQPGTLNQPGTPP
jgi:protein TonB